MNFIGIKCQRSILIICFFVVGVIGTVNLAGRLEFSIETGQVGDKVIVLAVKSGGNAETAGIRVGDRLLTVGDRSITNQAVARWALKGVQFGGSVIFQVERSGAVISIPSEAEPPFHPGFIILNALLGLTFITVGLMVWWTGNRDPTVKSFFRLTSLTGLAILLFSHENNLQPDPLHFTYSYTWLLTYCLIPATLLEFIIRFTSYNRPTGYRPLMYRILYLPAVAVLIGLGFSYYAAYIYADPIRITRYETLFNIGLGSLLLVYFSVSIILLFLHYLRPVNQAEKDRVRWILICTVIGLAPFFILYKTPVILGLRSLIPLWAAFGMMLIVPIGWGMAVASFRMLRLEWALSRTIIYAITVALVLYLMSSAVLIGFRYFEQKDTTSLVVLVAVGLIAVILSISGLIGQIRTLIDRIYYRDWFNYRSALLDLSVELSGSISEKSVVQILTERLPTILKIEKSILLVRTDSETWHAPVQAAPLIGNELELLSNISFDSKSNGLPILAMQSVRDSLDQPSADLLLLGYHVILPLVHAESVTGILLLGGKLSGAPFSVRDHLLLNTLSTYAGTALANLNLTGKLIDNEKRTVAVDMAGGIAHEINNALAPLMGQAQLMERTLTQGQSVSSDGTVKRPVDIIIEMCRRIKRIAQNLNRISEPPRPMMEPVHLSAVAEETLQLMTETAGRIKQFRTDDPNAKFQLVKELDENLPVVMGDRQQLGQVFMNLIINASDALEEQGEGTLTIGTAVRHDQNAVTGYVRDTGGGIPAHLMDKIFQPYFTTKSKGKGTGLGMPIVRGIIEAHGGQIRIDSRENHGTCVEFSLPLTAQQPGTG